MNISFALLARFESPTVELKVISEEFFGYTPKTAEQKAKAQDLPIPTFKLRDSERSPSLVNVADLATYVEQRYRESKSDWDIIQQAKQ
ncbi:pyocin activator PrtN family protein [Shewanella sp. GutDb-MelDb]|jgi:hypothetical protein|uniref:pyocin activator PrtN family protein n=1 Tax=Shewanella sp. GutDb-MelDb TaxID=2058316 RepID=UPI000C7A9C64|nr:pyocin activator PrtN family protein [Shewanella sp. GutDb-MelDb]PKG58000.1 pyocin activator protein PrtN [Shewanella sp. GutDb-MelDb]